MSRTDHHGDRKKKDLKPFWKWVEETPGWWVRLTMTKPQRRAGTLWERDVEKTEVVDLKETDDPPHGRKPHIYYW